MRLDLHNHILSCTDSFYPFNKVYPQHNRALYFRLFKSHRVDGVAITNYHNIDTALELYKQYPKQVIVGSEYRVLADEGNSVLISVLNITQDMHNFLMKERFRGLEHFTTILREKNLPFFLSHLGYGIELSHPKSLEILDKTLNYFEAIEVLDAYSAIENFSFFLARYYNLAPIAGTGYLHADIERCAYTEAKEAKSFKEFWDAVLKRNITIGCLENSINNRSWWSISKDFYQRQIKKIWHTELGFWQHFSIQEVFENLEDSVLVPVFQSLPHFSHLQDIEALQNKKNDWNERFVDYLIQKKIQSILKQYNSKEDITYHCIEALHQINACFHRQSTFS